MLHLQNLFAASRPAHGGMQQDQRAHVLRPVLKEALPRPPRPPWASRARCPACSSSARAVPASSSPCCLTMVPMGTGMMQSAPLAPWQQLPVPGTPGLALHRPKS